MVTEQDLLAGIVGAPDELDRWLILADWLEDQGDPRAELARLRHALHAEPNSTQRPDWLGRQLELLDAGLDPVVPAWTNFLGMSFALVLPGSFQMGSPDTEDHRLSSETLHPVTLTRPYLLGQHPVRRGEFARFVSATGYRTRAEEQQGETTWVSPGYEQTDDHPVVSVCWEDAQAMIAWLNEVEPERGFVYGLPSEAQWEYACRAGTQTAYFWGNDAGRADEFAWVSETSPGTTQPVNTLRPNAWGLWHMHGLIWEWCLDYFRTLSPDPATDPLMADGDEDGERLSRGGSYDHHVSVCRSACRGFDPPGESHAFDGFRLAVFWRKG